MTCSSELAAHADLVQDALAMLLELMLTCARERSALITSAENMSFLVLDELHTYRGRQGADVVMRVRRLGGAVGSTKVPRGGQHIGVGFVESAGLAAVVYRPNLLT